MSGNQRCLVVDILTKGISTFIYPLPFKCNFFSVRIRIKWRTYSPGVSTRAVVEPGPSLTRLCELKEQKLKKTEKLPESKR